MITPAFIRPFSAAALTLAVCLAFALPGCQPRKTAPAPQAQTAPAVRRPATILEERAMLEAEKQELVGNYSENLERIQQINARIIEINILLSHGAKGD